MKLDFRIFFVFISVVLIWGSTPLAIQWSNLDNGYLFAVAARMSLGGILAFAILFASGGRMVFRRKSWIAYLAAGLGLYFGMIFVYKAATMVPSGWIAVMFSINPLITGFLAHYILEDERLTYWQVISLLIAVAGVILIFQDGLGLSDKIVLGLVLVFIAVVLYAVSNVLVAKFSTGISPMAINTGAHLIVVPLFVITWAIFDYNTELHFSFRGAISLIYLAVMGSVFGFVLFYYLLQRVGANRSAIIMMITPVAGLLIGYELNDEPVSIRLLLGTVFLIVGVGLNIWHSGRKNWTKPVAG